jgi:hypothetical protein
MSVTSLHEFCQGSNPDEGELEATRKAQGSIRVEHGTGEGLAVTSDRSRTEGSDLRDDYQQSSRRVTGWEKTIDFL